MHVSLSLMMLAAGKHVLCEKPMSLTDAGAKKVLEFAQQKQLLYLEVSDLDFLCYILLIIIIIIIIIITHYYWTLI